jgi:hypothetical protein
MREEVLRTNFTRYTAAVGTLDRQPICERHAAEHETKYPAR